MLSRRLWTPTRKMVETFERRLAPRLAHERLPPADLWAQVRRRYLGMFEYGTGRKLMYVSLGLLAVGGIVIRQVVNGIEV